MEKQYLHQFYIKLMKKCFDWSSLTLGETKRPEQLYCQKAPGQRRLSNRIQYLSYQQWTKLTIKIILLQRKQGQAHRSISLRTHKRIQINQCFSRFFSLSSIIVPTLLSDSSHLRISSSRESSLAILAMHIFSTRSFQLSSAHSRSMPISLSRKSSSSEIRSWQSYLLNRFSFSRSFILLPWSNTKVMMGRTSMSFLGAMLVVMVLADSAAFIAEVGLLILTLELGFGTSSSSSPYTFSPRLDLSLFVSSPDSRLFAPFFLFSSIFLMRCWTSALRSLSSIILLDISKMKHTGRVSRDHNGEKQAASRQAKRRGFVLEVLRKSSSYCLIRSLPALSSSLYWKRSTKGCQQDNSVKSQRTWLMLLWMISLLSSLLIEIQKRNQPSWPQEYDTSKVMSVMPLEHRWKCSFAQSGGKEEEHLLQIILEQFSMMLLIKWIFSCRLSCRERYISKFIFMALQLMFLGVFTMAQKVVCWSLSSLDKFMLAYSANFKFLLSYCTWQSPIYAYFLSSI